MKKITMMSGDEIIISDDEAENISLLPDNTRFVKLRDGSLVNMASISSIVDFKGFPFIFCGVGMCAPSWKRIYTSKDGSLYFINGKSERVQIPFDSFKEIEYFPPEKVDNAIGIMKKDEQLLLEKKSEREKEERKK